MIRIKINNKQYKLREEAQCVYELIGIVLAILTSYGLFYATCGLIVYIAKEVMMYV